MALSKKPGVCQWIFPQPLSLSHPPSSNVKLPAHCFLHFVPVHFSVSLSYVPLSLSLHLSLPPFFLLADKLDEILAAAQQTISTNEAPGTRGQGPKRDRGRSFYGNEVCIVLQ